jgi:hypothetical protein
LGRRHLTNEEVEKNEQELIQELKRKLKKNKGKAPISGDDFVVTPEIEKFENF